MTDLTMTKFPRKVRDTVTTLVNHHEVRYRQLDSNHVRLYCGDRSVHPFKLAANRPEQHTMRYLDRWIDKNVPEFRVAPTQPKEDDMKHAVPKPHPVVDKPATLKPVQMTGAKITDADHAANVAALDEETSYRMVTIGKGDDARVSEYLYHDEGIIKCLACDYTSTTRQGVHLHENSHTGNHTGGRKPGPRTGLSANEAAVRTLMKHFHIKGDTEKLEAENAALRQQVADLKAKLALVKEAMSA